MWANARIRPEITHPRAKQTLSPRVAVPAGIAFDRAPPSTYAGAAGRLRLQNPRPRRRHRGFRLRRRVDAHVAARWPDVPPVGAAQRLGERRAGTPAGERGGAGAGARIPIMRGLVQARVQANAGCVKSGQIHGAFDREPGRSQAECRRFDPGRPLCPPPMSHDDTGGFLLAISCSVSPSRSIGRGVGLTTGGFRGTACRRCCDGLGRGDGMDDHVDGRPVASRASDVHCLRCPDRCAEVCVWALTQAGFTSPF